MFASPSLPTFTFNQRCCFSPFSELSDFHKVLASSRQVDAMIPGTKCSVEKYFPPCLTLWILSCSHLIFMLKKIPNLPKEGAAAHLCFQMPLFQLCNVLCMLGWHFYGTLQPHNFPGQFRPHWDFCAVCIALHMPTSNKPLPFGYPATLWKGTFELLHNLANILV